MEFETLDSKIAKGIKKIIPADVKSKINVLEETQYKNKCPMLTGRQILYQIFSFFNIDETQGHILNMNDLLNVELYNDTLKMFDLAWEETLLPMGNDLDDGVSSRMCTKGKWESLHSRRTP